MSWPLVKLESVSVFIRNGASIKQSGDAAGLAITRIETIADRTVNLDKCGYADVSENEYLNYRLRFGDILVSHINSEKHLAKCAIFESDRSDIVHGMNLLCLRPNYEVVFPKYLFHYLSSPEFLKFIPAITKKSVNQASFTVSAFKDLEIPLPSLAEQKRIAAILDKADAIRRKRQQAIQLADDFLRAVFLEMFGDPVTNPKGWEVARLGDVVESQLGKMLSQKAKEGKSPKKYLRNANVRWRKFSLDDLLEMDFNSKELKKFELKNGDLLVCEGGDVGRCSIWRDNIADCYYQKALHRVRPSYEVLTPEYLQEYFFWMSKRGGLTDSVSEVTFSHLTAEKLKELRIPLPPIDFQIQFSCKYRKIDALMSRYESVVSVENDNFSSISQKAFSGAIK